MMEGPSRLACADGLDDGPRGPLNETPLPMHDLEEAIACFSEIDTEFSPPAMTKVAYLEQRLRLEEPAVLDARQAAGRRFLLDMLGLLSLPATQGEAQEPPRGWEPAHPYKYLLWLLRRTAQDGLAAAVAGSAGVCDLAAADLAALCRWAALHGLQARELGQIQPNFFTGRAAERVSDARMHPRLWQLAEESSHRSTDYLSMAFRSMAGAEHDEPQGHGRGEALAAVFEQVQAPGPYAHGRWKVFFPEATPPRDDR
jgi:hypothetical protein